MGHRGHPRAADHEQHEPEGKASALLTPHGMTWASKDLKDLHTKVAVWKTQIDPIYASV